MKRPEDARPADDRLERIWRAVAAIPRGGVDTYGGVARRAGLGRRARLVGHALKVAPSGLRLPWHRVLGAGLRISFPRDSADYKEQRRRLEAEGHRFAGGRIVPAAHGPAPRDALDRWLWGPRRGAP
jgi:methylated-DNA-protein-cysteine methyltransferase-like protein